jgi:hypothetical protein
LLPLAHQVFKLARDKNNELKVLEIEDENSYLKQAREGRFSFI